MGLGSYLGSWFSSEASKATRAADLIAKKALAFPKVPTTEASTAVTSTVPETVATTTPATSFGGTDTGNQSDAGTGTSNGTTKTKRTVQFPERDIDKDDLWNQLSVEKRKHYEVSVRDTAVAKAAARGGGDARTKRHLHELCVQACKRDRQVSEGAFRPDEHKAWWADELGEVAAEQYKTVLDLSKQMGRTMTESELQSIVRGQIKQKYGDVSDIVMTDWTNSAKPCPNTGWTTLSADEHMKDELAKTELRKTLKTTEGLSQDDFDKLYRRYGSRYHKVDLDGPLSSKVKGPFNMAELSRDERVPEKWTSAQRELVLSAMELETQLTEYGASADQIKVAMKRYVLENTKSHTVKESDDGKVTIAYNPVHLEWAGGVSASHHGQIMSVTTPMPDPSAPPTTFPDKSKSNPLVADDPDMLNAWEFEQEIIEISQRPPRLKYTAMDANSGTSESIQAAMADWEDAAKTGLTKETPDKERIMIDQLTALDRMSQAFEETYKFDYRSATELSKWLTRCRRKGWTFGKSATDPSKKEVVFKEKHLSTLEKGLTDYCQSAGITPTDTPRQMMVAGIEAMESGRSEAWDGTEIRQWQYPPKCRVDGSKPPTADEVTNRLLGKYYFSTLVDGAMSAENKHLSAKQRGVISTYLTDQPNDKIQGELQMVLQKLRENPNWAPSKDGVSPGSETTTATTSEPPASTRPATTSPTVPPGGQPETRAQTAAPSGDQKASAKLPKLQYSSATSTSAPGEEASPGQPKSVQWSIMSKPEKTEEDIENAFEEAVTVLQSTHALGRQYPELDWASTATLSKYISDLEGVGYMHDRSTGETKLSSTHYPQIKADISKYMKDAGLEGEEDPDSVLQTSISSYKSKAEAWDNQDLEHWAKLPPGRPGTSAKLSSAEAFVRLAQVDQLAGTISGMAPGPLNTDQSIRMATCLADQSQENIMPAFQEFMGQIRNEPNWRPGPDFVLPAASSKPSEASTTDTRETGG